MRLASNTAPSALEQFAHFATHITLDNLPREVIAKAKLCIVDALAASLTLGVTAEGSQALQLATSRRAAPTATVVGSALMTSVSDAAFVNAVSAAGTARSDTHTQTASHPGSVIIPAVLAICEAQSCNGTQALLGVVAGYEAMCRIGQAIISTDLARIFRPTGLIGPTGAAIGAGTAAGLDVRELRNAASLATHTASGLNEWAHSGTSELVFHGGFAARNAVDAVYLAQAGMLSADTILEGRAGLLAGYQALENIARLTEGLSHEYRILEVSHKPAPACIFVQTPCQVMLELLRKHPLEVANIAAIRIYVSQAAVQYPGCDDPGPVHDARAAKMSIQFGVASVLAMQGLSDANWRNYQSPANADLCARCELVVDEALTQAFPARVGCRIEIELTSGERIAHQQDDFISMSEQDVHARFLAAAVQRLGAIKAVRALEIIDRLEIADSLIPLMAELRLTQA